MANNATQSNSEFPSSKQLVNTAPSPTPEALAAIERLAGSVFPDDYRRFLLTYNGGTCDGWLMLTQDIVIARLYGVRDDSDSLEEAIEWGRESEEPNPLTESDALPPPRLPEEVISIGEDPTGHRRFCLALSGDHAGSVWLCDCGAEYAPEYDGTLAAAKHMTKVAASFADFLKRLGPYEHKQPKPQGVDKVLAEDDGVALIAFLAANAPTPDLVLKLSYKAAQHNAASCFRLLVDRGVPGRTALEHACLFGRVDLVRELLARGEPPKLFHRMAAAGSKHFDIVRLLDEAMKPKQSP